ncbi:sulfatase-like hydrolase/transferase [Lacibacter luteus]|uniref:sulfatase-like hydrolase/transferase n=1 Tax=Lacibacter luteus TaxID=2508719 RepID=UPI0013E92A70|nr:sulfatase-like hydrolase/transferase [Lacibacter luteus]
MLLLSEIPNSIKRHQLDKSVHNLIDFRFSVFNEYKPQAELPDSSKPDIYFLLFDAMASSQSVQQTTGRNIHPLDSFLQQKGFYLASAAAANYNWTIHSVSTTLNMEYLPPWITPVKDDMKVYFWGSSSFKDNSLFRILNKEGYQIKSYQPISFNNPDWPGNSYFINLKKDHYYFKTLPGRIYRDIFWNYSRIDFDFVRKQQFRIMQKRNEEKKQLLDTTIALIKQSCSDSGAPKFIYGHFMIPHDPYVFDSAGNLKEVEKTIVRTSGDELQYYYQQLQYATVVIKDLVNYIQTHNRKNSIIIVAGDHGFKTEDARVKGYSFNNYSAYYFPDQEYGSMYKSASPVNTFRLVLNKYFNAKLPLLKDSSTLVVPEKKETIKKSEKIQPTHTPSTPNQ